MPDSNVLEKALRLFLEYGINRPHNWWEALAAANNMLSTLSELRNQFEGVSRDEAKQIITKGIDPLIGKEPNAVIGTHETAQYRVNIGLIGDEGFEVLSDMAIRVSVNAILNFIY